MSIENATSENMFSIIYSWIDFDRIKDTFQQILNVYINVEFYYAIERY